MLFFFSLNFLIWSAVFNLAEKADMTIHFFDVGQGDAIFIEAKDGAQILIDGGPNGRILSHLGNAMQYGDNFIDAIIISHPHADHISGLINVLKKYNVGIIIESGVNYNTAEFYEFEKLAKEKKIKRILIQHPASLKFFKEATLRLIYPDKSYVGANLKNVHDAAVVSELYFEGKKILFMADAERKTEDYLLARNSLEDVDVLKAGHHGSKTSSNSEFLKVTKPEYAVISVGAKNRYGHPHQDALSRLASAGAKIFRTDIGGTITLEIRNGELIWK